MDKLQISLAIAATAGVGLVALINSLQARRLARERALREELPASTDQSSQGFAFDGGYGGQNGGVGSSSSVISSVASTGSVHAAETANAPHATEIQHTSEVSNLDHHIDSPLPPVPAVLDDAVDCIVTLKPEQCVLGSDLMAQAQRLRHIGSKPVVFEGRLRKEKYWTRPRPGDVYDLVRGGILLANRRGALNAIEYSDFVHQMNGYADQIRASVEVPEMNETLATARSLDQLCAQLDVQIGMHLICDEDLLPTQEEFQLILDGFGFTERPDGRFAYLNHLGQSLFTATINITKPHISFMFDMPRVPQALDSFRLMRQRLEQLSEKLGAVCVDDNQRQLTPEAFQRIERAVAIQCDEMERQAIAAGSQLALRLFS